VTAAATASSWGGRLRPRDHAVAAGLAIAYVAVLFATAGDLAMSRDESFYVVAAERYGDWLALVWNGPSRGLSRSAIDGAWSYNAEHPPLMKLAFALSWNLHRATGWFPSDGHAFRFPGMLAGGWLLAVVYLFGVDVGLRRGAAAFAAIALGTLPRVFYHAHLDAFDVPIALMTTCATWAYWRTLGPPGFPVRRLLVFGVAYGLALATKHNSWILPGIFAIHFGWVAVLEGRARRRGSPPRIDRRPWWLGAALLVGVPLAVGLWPWLWHDTWSRLGGYARFHLNHAYYNIAYFGKNYFEPPFPVSFPFVMTAITVPATTLALAALGLGGRLRALLPPGAADRWPALRALPGPPPDPRATDVLLVGALLAPLVVIALPSTPIFGATKHWFPAYPFLVLYAGHGLELAAERIRRFASDRGAHRLATALPAATALVALTPSAVAAAHAHPFGLSHYTSLVGGPAGAADLGMNRQFWGFAHGPLVPTIRELLPDGGRVWTCDATATSWQMLHRDGRLPPSIRATPSMATADLVLVHHEHHFAEVDFQVWQAFGTVQPAGVLTYDGVPIVSLYANPDSRRVAGGSEPPPGARDQGRGARGPVR